MGEKLHRRKKRLFVFNSQSRMPPEFFINAPIQGRDRKEPPGAPYPKLSFTRLEHIAYLLAHPDVSFEDISFASPEQGAPNLVASKKGEAIHRIQLLGQVWRRSLPNKWEGERHDYPRLYEQNLQNISTILPTVSSDNLTLYRTLLQDVQLGLDPSTHDDINKNRRRVAYQIITRRVLEDMFLRSPFTDTPSFPFERDGYDELPFVDPGVFCNLWDARGTSEEVMQQTEGIFSHHETLPYMRGVIGHGLSGLEVRYSVLLHGVGVMWTGHIDELSRDASGLSIVDFKSGSVHRIPTTGIESEALKAALSLTARAARTFSSADLLSSGHAIELTNYDLSPVESEPVNIRYASFADGKFDEHDFSSWEYFWNNPHGAYAADAFLQRILGEVAQDHDRFAPLLQ